MTQTRADLDRKLTELETRAHDMSPRRYVERNMPEYFGERVIGGVLTLVGLKMAWGMYQGRARRRTQVRTAMASYGRW